MTRQAELCERAEAMEQLTAAAGRKRPTVADEVKMHSYTKKGCVPSSWKRKCKGSRPASPASVRAAREPGKTKSRQRLHAKAPQPRPTVAVTESPIQKRPCAGEAACGILELGID